MSLLFPRFAYVPARCTPARHEVAPLWSLFDDTINELQRASRQSSRRPFNPRFDVKETKDSYTLEGELPGLDQKNINIEFVDEHTIRIKGHTGTGISEAVEAAPAPQAVQEGTATPTSDAFSVKSHQATAEDDPEEPANTSAVAEQSAPVAEASQPQSTQATESKKTERNFWYRERSLGEFSRSFSFQSRVDQDAVRASLKNGILSIVVPKAAVPESRRINIE